MKLNYFLFLLFFIFCSCSQPVKEVYIDNPSGDELTIEFENGEVITIAAYMSDIKELEYGTRKIKVNGGEAEEIKLEEKYEYLLNPLKETYYLQKVKYFTSIQAQSRYYKNHALEKSEVNGMEVNGDYVKIEGKILIKKTWNVGLDEELTARAKGSTTSKKGYLTASKIHREKDIVAKINQETVDYIKKEFEKMEHEHK